jgi:hypothetical protein
MTARVAEAAADGKYLAARIYASGATIAELENKTGFSKVQISRWRYSLNDDRRRSKFASELFITTYASFLGLTRCLARAELSRRPRGEGAP